MENGVKYDRVDEKGKKMESNNTVGKGFLGLVRKSYPHSIRSELTPEVAMSKPHRIKESLLKIKFINMKKIEEKLFQYFKDHIILETEDPEEIRKVFQEFLITNAYCHVFKVNDIPDVNEMEVSANKNEKD